jgi:L-lactate dehydrogenase complex protein LldE
MGENRRVAGTVQLFATCLGDLFFPEAVEDAAMVLREGGLDVAVPAGQVCCGQPAFNSGHRRAARRVARTFVRAFDRDLPVVVPSGSCATMLAHYLPELVDAEPFQVHELSAYLDGTGAPLSELNRGRRLAYHDSCHMLRELGIADAPRRLLERSGAALVPLPRPDLCCGFGGTFSVRQPEVSVALADEKLAGAAAAEALVTADPGCLMHLRGRASRTSGPPVVHLASALARGVPA